MTNQIESYAEFQMELSNLLQRAKETGLDDALLAGILLDYRDHIKMSGSASEVPADFKQ
jgi:hypothetical protein